MAPLVGAGFLLTNDLLTDCAYVLLQPSVSTTVPAGGIAAGTATVATFDPSMYPSAQIVVGAAGSADIEVVTIISVVEGVSFTALFANAHAAGEPIVGATFPVRQTTDPFYTQGEMLAYLSTAQGDFLEACPLLYALGFATVNAQQQNAALPSDCMVPMRMAVNNYPLRETSQANLDAYQYNWAQQGLNNQMVYFRDKVGLQNFGVWPRAGNKTQVAIVYQQRSAQLVGLADGFLIPDPFLIYLKYRVLAIAYTKDGEMRAPALAKYYDMRYELGVKISRMVLDSIQDPNLDITS